MTATQKEIITSTAITMAASIGLVNLTRSEVCEVARVPVGSFSAIMGCGFVEFIEQLKAEGHTGPNNTITRARVHPSFRRDSLLTAAIFVAKRDGLGNLTREAIAEQAGVSGPLVTRVLGTMKQLKRALMRHAVQTECLPVIAQGIAAGNVYALKAPEPLRKRAVNWLSIRNLGREGEGC